MNRTKQELEDRLLDYLYDEMPAQDRSAFVSEIRQDPQLQERLEQFQAVQQKAGALKMHALPSHLHTKLAAEAHRATHSGAAHTPKLTLVERLSVFLLRPAFATAAVAVILTGVGLFYADKSLFKEPSPTDILAARPESSPQPTSATAPTPAGEAARPSEDPGAAVATRAPAELPSAIPGAPPAEPKWEPAPAAVAASEEVERRAAPPAPPKPVGGAPATDTKPLAVLGAADGGGAKLSKANGTDVAELSKNVDKKAAEVATGWGKTNGVPDDVVSAGTLKKEAAANVALDGAVADEPTADNQALYGGVGAGYGDVEGKSAASGESAQKAQYRSQSDTVMVQKTAPVAAEVAEAEEAGAPTGGVEQVDQGEAEGRAGAKAALPQEVAPEEPAADVSTHELALSYFKSRNVAASAKVYDDLLTNYPGYVGRKKALAEAVTVYLLAGQRQKAEAALAELESSTSDPARYAHLRNMVDGKSEPTKATSSMPAKPASKKAGPKQAAPPADSMESPLQ